MLKKKHTKKEISTNYLIVQNGMILKNKNFNIHCSKRRFVVSNRTFLGTINVC